MKAKVIERLRELLDEFTGKLGEAAHVYFKIKTEAIDAIKRRKLEDDMDVKKYLMAFDEVFKEFVALLPDEKFYEIAPRIDEVFAKYIPGDE